MSIKPAIKERLAERLKRMEDATTPSELAYTIWTKQLEEAMQSSRQSYRDCLIEWIVAYKENRKPNLCNKYQTPMEVAEGIWKPYLCNNEEDKLWFGSLREGLVKWINSYCNKS